MLTKRLLDSDQMEVPYAPVIMVKIVYFSSVIIVPITVSNRVCPRLATSRPTALTKVERRTNYVLA